MRGPPGLPRSADHAKYMSQRLNRDSVVVTYSLRASDHQLMYKCASGEPWAAVYAVYCSSVLQ